MKRDAWEVYSSTFAVCVVVFLADRTLANHLSSKISPAFRWAAAFAVVQAITLLLLSLYLLAQRAYARMKESIYGQMRPAIRDRILALAFEGEAWSTDVPESGPGRRVMEQTIAESLTTLKASGRDRVARFALEHGFVAQWINDFSSRSKSRRKRAIHLLGLVSSVAGSTVLVTALEDKYAAIRVEACRALLSGDQLDTEVVFRSVLRESLLIRALLADDLKRHARYLLKSAIPSLLETTSSLEKARCFEMLIAWKRALPSLDIQPWLEENGDPQLQQLALALLPYVSADVRVEDYVIAALKNDDPELQCSAAHVAGRLKLTRLIPLLSAALGKSRRLALASANAIAQMGEQGERCLEKIITGSDRNAAAFAMEALEHATVRLH